MQHVEAQNKLKYKMHKYAKSEQAMSFFNSISIIVSS